MEHTFTLDDLRSLLRVDDAVDMTATNADVFFDELGYDSLALLEFSSQLLRQFGVRIPDSDLSELRTPRHAVDYVNELLSVHPSDVKG